MGKLLLQENVLLGNVSENKGDLGLILGVVEDSTDQLVHGGDSSSSSNAGDVLVLVGGPLVLHEGSLEGEHLSVVHVVKVGRHGSSLVLLDDEVHVSTLLLISGGGVGTDSGLCVVGSLVLGEKARGDLKTGDVVLRGELESQKLGVGGEVLGLDKLQVGPLSVTNEGGDRGREGLRGGTGGVEVVSGAGSGGGSDGSEGSEGGLLLLTGLRSVATDTLQKSIGANSTSRKCGEPYLLEGSSAAESREGGASEHDCGVVAMKSPKGSLKVSKPCKPGVGSGMAG